MHVNVLQSGVELTSSMANTLRERGHTLYLTDSLEASLSDGMAHDNLVFLVLIDGGEITTESITALCRALPEATVLALYRDDGSLSGADFLYAGADDALDVDICSAELHARMVSIACRKIGLASPVFDFFGLQIDWILRRTQFQGVDLPISMSDFQFLERLSLKTTAAGLTNDSAVWFSQH